MLSLRLGISKWRKIKKDRVEVRGGPTLTLAGAGFSLVSFGKGHVTTLDLDCYSRPISSTTIVVLLEKMYDLLGPHTRLLIDE